jgi:hypothetical protein
MQNKPSRSLSRLYLTGSGSKRSRISGSTPPSSGAYSGPDPYQTLSTPNSEGDSPTARAASPLLPGPPDSVNSADPLNIRPGRSVVEQIGYPDREGWMRKKGERYNTWKLRYFVLKGPHLYYLRSQAVSKFRFSSRPNDLINPYVFNRRQKSRVTSILKATASWQTKTQIPDVTDLGSSTKVELRIGSVPTNNLPSESG